MPKCRSCSRCAVEGRAHCARCLKSAKLYARKRRAHADPRMCNRCFKAAPIPGKRLCQACSAASKRYLQKARQGLRAAGRCMCGRLAEQGKKTCALCLERQANRHHSIPKGICLNCRKAPSSPGRRWCQTCRDRHSAWYAKIPKGTCPKCRERPSMPWRRECVECYDRLLQQQYGIDGVEYARLHEKQKGVCAVCAKPSQGRRLAVDHDHATGRVRGLLCNRCNTTLGLLEDSPELIGRLREYVKAHR
jgi:hypothetical protein